MSLCVGVLGATGSVGQQALDVCRERGYRVDFISIGKNVRLGENIVREFSPRAVAVADDAAAKELKLLIKDTETEVLSGDSGITRGIEESSAESFVNSITGMAGLRPTLAIIERGKRLCLANKESLVIAGDIVMSEARHRGTEIIPVDSEHSAIFQSLKSGRASEIKRILLTASGGPFFGKTRSELSGISAADTLKHPTWKMGKRISVDSATLINKGFEIIEAAHLFGVGASKIEVVVHRESILHSAVEYVDNTVIAEMSVPDMRSCIQYALDYPERRTACVPELDLFSVGSLSFSRPDTETFPLLSLAKRAMEDGGAMGAVLNAADEVAVGAHLSGALDFLGISDTVCEVYERMRDARELHTLEEILSIDRECRTLTESLIRKRSKK